MSVRDLPENATWHHHGSREGFEAVFFSADETGYHLDGHTVATEGGIHGSFVTRSHSTNDGVLRRPRSGLGRTWAVERYGSTPSNQASGKSMAPLYRTSWAASISTWSSSCCTNTFPVHRLRLGVGGSADTPAAYVRALDLSVQRLEQRYRRVDDTSSRQRYEYQAPAFDFSAVLIYDESGLLLEYPGIGSRVL